MKQYAILGHYSETVAEFYIFSGETNKQIGSVVFMLISGYPDSYKLTNNEIDEDLIKTLKPVASDLIKKMNNVF